MRDSARKQAMAIVERTPSRTVIYRRWEIVFGNRVIPTMPATDGCEIECVLNGFHTL